MRGHASTGELDVIEELRLRRWARENYVPRSQRQKSWHAVVHEEMASKDREQVPGLGVKG
jgi:hypothetical protein